jgi:4-amino-4-deoxy-L-arabinose transferase-like glycosyltransferase
VLFGVWALVHVAVFSSQKGIFHPYYVSALAPAVAALSGIGVVQMSGWARRSWAGLAVLAATIAGTAWLAVALLDRTADFAPALRIVVPVAAVLAIGGIVALRAGGGRLRGLVAATAVAGAIALAAGPASYAVADVGHALNGNNVLAGPSGVGSGGMGGGPGGGGRTFSGTRPGGAPPSGGTAPSGASAARTGGGAMGGGGSIGADVITYLEANQGSAKYLLAASGSQATASVIIATGKPVVTIGGFGGSDPAPTVAQLAKMVANGELKYVLVGADGGGGGGPGGGSASSALTTWVKAHGKAVTAVTTTSGTLYEVSA